MPVRPLLRPTVRFLRATLMPSSSTPTSTPFPLKRSFSQTEVTPAPAAAAKLSPASLAPHNSNTPRKPSSQPNAKHRRLDTTPVSSTNTASASSSTKPATATEMDSKSASSSRKSNHIPHPPRQTANTPRSVRGTPKTPRGGALSRSSPSGPPLAGKGKGKAQSPAVVLDGPEHDEKYIYDLLVQGEMKSQFINSPKSVINDYLSKVGEGAASYSVVVGLLGGRTRTRATVIVRGIEGIGDAANSKEAQRLAAMSVCVQMQSQGIFDQPIVRKPMEVERRLLSDGTEIAFETARQFMDYYCRRFGFGKPDIAVSQDISKPTKGASRLNAAWEAVMTVGGRRIGVGTGISKKHANINCYIDVCQYLESCDRELWEGYVAFSKSKQATMAPNVWFQISDHLEDGIGDLCDDLRKSQLYANRPKIGSGLTGFDVPPSTNPSQPVAARNTPRPGPTEEWHQTKSKKLLANYEAYQSDPRVASMRRQRLSLPVTSCANDILSHLAKEDVTICMATTGSGKTTQIPQLIFDDWIKRGEGSRCNIICTQPRRIAAISVAERVAAERGERVGMSVGYQVRFEAKLPTDHGSVTFCTTGTFLRRMQSALGGTDAHERSRMDDVTHVLVDEVHERDIDTDLLLVVLKRLLNDRKARNKSLKIVLMSATIDPTLFQTYFADDQGKPAQIAEVPGRLFPVEKRYLDELVAELSQSGLRDASWVLGDKKVVDHLQRELGPPVMDLFSRRGPAPNPPPQPIFGQDEDLDIPYPLVALTVAHVLKQSDSGHVLVFLPGWDEITAVQNILLDRTRPLLGVDFTDPRRFSIHLLHSSIPIAEQQAVFEPAAPGVRRIILATNIAETSITIPDVVYVVDTGKIKEKRYDPERHMSSLVSAWVGTSNLNQRAGRAGRHRSGQYYGLMSRGRVASLHSHQLVEMKRADLSNVVMHVKALDFPGMEIEEVLAATIEPPAPSRVSAAITNLQRVGALDPLNNLTSLGRVLLQLPVEVAVGRLVLLGSFFKCLDSALTLAAILTNRDPFMAPIALKQEANAIKNSWTPAEFRSDSLAILRAYNAWERLQQRGDFVGANRFCVDNFLSRTTLLLIEKIKGHLLQSLYNAGVIDVSSGGAVRGGSSRPRDHTAVVPPELNSNGDSLPLLAALIAAASQPNFAVRASDKIYRTSQDKITFIHPSSVNHRNRDPSEADFRGEKQLFAFAEKVRNVSTAHAQNAQTFLRNCTRLDPMTYMLFGAYHLEVTERGLDCDDWLPITGNIDALDNIQRLKTLVDSCMLRVYEGIGSNIGKPKPPRTTAFASSPSASSVYRIPQRAREAVDEEEEEDRMALVDSKGSTLSDQEIKELDWMTRDIVKILNQYSEERLVNQSRHNSRPATPSTYSSPGASHSRLPAVGPSGRGLLGMQSGYSTPYNRSRPATPSGLRGHYLM